MNKKIKIYKDLKYLIMLYEYYYNKNIELEIQKQKEKEENIGAKKLVLKRNMY